MSALRKTVSAFSALAIVASTMAPAMTVVAASEFVPYADALASAGVIKTVTSVEGYRLEDHLTRAEMAKIGVNLKMLNDKTVALTNCTGKVYGDVDAKLGDLCSYIETAASIGMVSVANANFRPSDNVTRAEMVKMLLVAEGKEPTNVDAGFTDIATIGDLSGYVNAAAAAGIVSKATLFRPNAPATRGEAFKVASNAAGLGTANNGTGSTNTGTDTGSGEIDLCDLFGDCGTSTGSVNTGSTSTGSANTGSTNTGSTNTGSNVATGNLEIGLSALTPASQSIPKNGSKVYIMATDFTAGSKDASISGLTFKHVGLSSRTSIDTLWVEINGVRLTTPRSVNSDNLVNMPLSTPYVVKAGQTITAKVYMSLVSSNTTTGDQIAFQLSAVEAGGQVMGLPLTSNTFTTSNYTLTPFNVTATATTTSVDVGSTNIDLTSNIQLENKGSSANSNVDLNLRSIIFRNNGSANLSQLANVGIYDASNVKISDRVVIDGNDMTVYFGTGYTIPKGGLRNVVLRGDIASAEQGRSSFSFEIRRSADVDVVEATTEFGASVIFHNGSNSSESLGTRNVNLGRITISRDSTTPSSTTKVPNTKNTTALVAKMQISEAIRAQNGIRIFVNGVSASALTFADFEANVDRIKVYYNDKLIDDITPSSTSFFSNGATTRATALTSSITDAGYQTTTSFDLPAGNGLLKVVVDFKNNTNAAQFTSYQFSVKEASFNNGLEYISSGRKVDTTSTSIGDLSSSTTDIVGTATSSNVAIGTSTISVTKSDSIGSRTVVKNTTLELMKVRFSNTDVDDVIISNLTMSFAPGASDGGNESTKIFFNNVTARDTNMSGAIVASSPLTSVKKTDAGRTLSLTNFRVPMNGTKELSIVGTVESTDFAGGDDVVKLTVTSVTAQFANNTGDPSPTGLSLASASFTYATSGQLTGLDEQNNVANAIYVGSNTPQTLGIFNVKSDVDDLKLTGVSFANLAVGPTTLAPVTDTDLDTALTNQVTYLAASPLVFVQNATAGATSETLGQIVTSNTQTDNVGDAGYQVDTRGTIFSDLSLEISTNGANGSYTKIASLDYNNGMIYRIDSNGSGTGAYANSKVVDQNAVIPAKNNNVYLRVRGTLNAPTTDNALSGRHVKLLMNRIVLESASTGDSISTIYTKSTGGTNTLALDNNMGKVFVLRKSRPNFTDPSRVSATLTVGDQSLFRFTVTPDAAGAVSLRKLVFKVSAKIGGADINAAAYDAGGVSNGTTNVFNDGGTNMLTNFKLLVNGSDVTSPNAVAYYAVRQGGVNYLVVDMTKRYAVTSATTFELRGNSSAAQTNDYVQVSIPKLSGTTLVTDTPANVSGTVDATHAGSASVVWSDETITGHGDNTADYTNDLFVTDGSDVITSQSVQRN